MRRPKVLTNSPQADLLEPGAERGIFRPLSVSQSTHAQTVEREQICDPYLARLEIRSEQRKYAGDVG